MNTWESGPGIKASVLLRMEFLDDSLMDGGPPPCAHKNFMTPRLRRCPYDPAKFEWETAKLLDYGMDGCVYRVNIGGKGPFALKLFWDNKLKTLPSLHYFAAQRECQNAALLQMLRTAIEEANSREAPVTVWATPETHQEALYNLLYFADEHRHLTSDGVPGSVNIDSMPRFAECYGWLYVNEGMIPRHLNPGTVDVAKCYRSLFKGENHIAIVYEYIEDVENDSATVEKVDRFLWLTGFSRGCPRKVNWRRSILVDH